MAAWPARERLALGGLLRRGCPPLHGACFDAARLERASWFPPPRNKIDAAARVRSRSDLNKAMSDGFGEIEKAKASIAGRVAGMGAGEALSMIGLDKRFVESEIEMVQSMAQGTAIEHHLEPSYFVAMATALDAAQGPFLPAPEGSSQDA